MHLGTPVAGHSSLVLKTLTGKEQHCNLQPALRSRVLLFFLCNASYLFILARSVREEVPSTTSIALVEAMDLDGVGSPTPMPPHYGRCY